MVERATTAMTFEGIGIFHLFVMALALAFLTAGIAHNKGGSFFKWFLAGAFLGIIALPVAVFKKKQLAPPALKQCPKCAEQLPIQALVCDRCDYNFVSMMVGCQTKPAPSPREQPVQLPRRTKNPAVQRASNHFAH